MRIKTDMEILDDIKSQLSVATIKFHDDTGNSFAAYQLTFKNKFEVWVNARTGEIFHGGYIVNRL